MRAAADFEIIFVHWFSSEAVAIAQPKRDAIVETVKQVIVLIFFANDELEHLRQKVVFLRLLVFHQLVIGVFRDAYFPDATYPEILMARDSFGSDVSSLSIG